MYWLRLAGLKGDARALQNIAEMFQQGVGVARDMTVASSFCVLCVTHVVGDIYCRKAEFNNAIHECRREVGKIDAIAVADDQ